MERTQSCFNMGRRACLCFLTRRKWSSMTFWTLGVVCGTEVYQPWWHICSETTEPVFLILWCYHATVWEEKEIMVMVGDSHIPDRPVTQISRHSVSGLLWSEARNTDWMFGCVLTNYLGTQKLASFSLLLKQRTWELRPQKFPLLGNNLLNQ